VGPEEIDYEEGDPIPPGYEKDTKIRKGLVIGGAVTFGVTWLLSILAASVAVSIEEEDDNDGDGDSDNISVEDAAALYIPVAGPFVSIVTYDSNAGGTAVLVIDGLAQAGGLAMLIAGLAAQETVLVRKGDVEIRPAPIVTADRAGAGVIGTF
jgi:hypothetical protein